MAKKKDDSTEQKEKKPTSLFDKTLEILSDRYGSEVVTSMEKIRQKPVKSISTGILSLDYIINPEQGGMVRGQVLDLYGADSSGKTTIALGMCANATANKEHVVYIDAEMSLSPKSVANANINEDYFKVVRQLDGQISADIAEALIKSGEVSLVVIDSLPQWKPLVKPKAGEETANFSQPKMAFQSLFHTHALGHLLQVASEHNTTLLIINQERSNLSGYGAPIQAFGGKAVKHYDSVRIRLTGKPTAKTEQIMDSQGNLIGQYTTAVAEKNKTSMPMREARVPIIFGYGVNPYMDIANQAVKCGVVIGTAGRYKWADTEEDIAHGLNNFTQLLFDNKEIYSKLKEEVANKLGIKYAENRKVINAFHDENLIPKVFK